MSGVDASGTLPLLEDDDEPELDAVLPDVEDDELVVSPASAFVAAAPVPFRLSNEGNRQPARTAVMDNTVQKPRLITMQAS